MFHSAVRGKMEDPGEAKRKSGAHPEVVDIPVGETEVCAGELYSKVL